LHHDLSEKFLKQIYLKIKDKVLEKLIDKNQKRKKVIEIEKLEDANNAGTLKSKVI